jgi:hypothetical protein
MDVYGKSVTSWTARDQFLERDFLFFSLLIGWQLSIWNFCKTFFSLLYICQLLCFWRLALSIVVEVFPWPFFSGYCAFKDVYYKRILPNYTPYP